MPSARWKIRQQDQEFLAFKNVSIRLDEIAVFKNTNWTWRAGEQWAILGPDGSGKSLLVQAILGRAPIIQGEVGGTFSKHVEEPSSTTPAALVSPQTQRELAAQESSFYQLRWHSGSEHGLRTVTDFLSQDSVENRNPFEVDPVRGSRSEFLRLRRQFVNWLGIKTLLPRRLIHLSNGEMRKVLLTHELLKSPRLLVLEDAWAGLDVATRRKLDQVVSRLMRNKWPVLIVTHRAEEIPAATTHVLLVAGHQVVAQGPKREMLAIWRKQFAVGKSQAMPFVENARSQPARHKETRSNTPLVELNRVTVKGRRRTILRDLNWTLREGECWALLGPNGAGKTTLLNLIQGDHPQAFSSDIRLFGRRTDSTQTLWHARQQIGWVSPELHQHYPGSWETADVVCSGFFNSIGLHQTCSRPERAAARQWLLNLGLARSARMPFGELPFGRQRLVLLARAVVKQPRLLILDEPCQGLDAIQRHTLLSAVDRVVEQTGASLIFVTHHNDEIPHCITHRLRLTLGMVREAGRLR